MTTLLVFAELDPAGVVRPTAGPLIARAAALGDVVVAISTAPGAGHAAADQLGALGVTRVLVAESPEAGSLVAAPEVAALAAAVQQVSPDAVLLSNSTSGREIAGRLAAKLRAGLTADATDLRVDGG